MTANDSDVSDGDILTGSQVVRVYGENLTAPFVTLTFGGVEYTPLARGEDYIEFILGDNGTAIINVDGSRFMSFEVEGIVIPEDLPVNFTMALLSSVKTSPPSSERHEPLTILSVNCINYPHVTNGEYPYFWLTFGIGNSSSDYYALNNCVLEAVTYPETSTRMCLSSIDANKPCYVAYRGFIIAVFNYTTD